MCACDQNSCASIDVSKQGEEKRCHRCDRKANDDCIKVFNGKDGLSLPTCVQCIQKVFYLNTIRGFVPVHSKVLVSIDSWNYECQSMQTDKPCKNIATSPLYQYIGQRPYSILCCKACEEFIKTMKLSLNNIRPPREHDLETLVKIYENLEQACPVGCGEECVSVHEDTDVCVVCNFEYHNHKGNLKHDCNNPKKTAGREVRATFVKKTTWRTRNLLRTRLAEYRTKRESERVKVFEKHQAEEKEKARGLQASEESNKSSNTSSTNVSISSEPPLTSVVLETTQKKNTSLNKIDD